MVRKTRVFRASLYTQRKTTMAIRLEASMAEEEVAITEDAAPIKSDTMQTLKSWEMTSLIFS